MRYELTIVVDDDAPNVVMLFAPMRDNRDDNPFRAALREPGRWINIGARRLQGDTFGNDREIAVGLLRGGLTPEGYAALAREVDLS